jgi:copper chaperone NosL
MAKIFQSACLIVFLAASAVLAQDDIKTHPSCPLCGMERGQHAHGRILIGYDDHTTLGTCSIHCLAVEMAARREKTIVNLEVADYTTGKLIPAAGAHWVLGGDKTGVMTRRAKWAFETKRDAEKFIRDHGGRPADYREVMKAAFEDMYEDMKMLREKRRMMGMGADVEEHPECLHCGMYRRRYDTSRMYLRYEGGKGVGTCSIHCAAIDLALRVAEFPTSIMVGDYRTKHLIDAGKAFWVIGGDKAGVMSIRGKWAFGEKDEALKFIQENKGRLGTFDEAMRATFEDMYEILR